MLASLLAVLGGLAASVGAWSALRSRHKLPSKVELVDATIDPAPAADSGVTLDIKVRNVGGQPAVLKRIVLTIEAALEYWSYEPPRATVPAPGAPLPPSYVYDAELPAPSEADGARVTCEISQVVPPGDADRFQVRIGPYREPYWREESALVYRLQLGVIHDQHDRAVTAGPLTISLWRTPDVPTAEAIHSSLTQFMDDVAEIRSRVDLELAHEGLVALNWGDPPPKQGNEVLWRSQASESCWQPERAIRDNLDSLADRLHALITILQPTTTRRPDLDKALSQAAATLHAIPALKETFQAL